MTNINWNRCPTMYLHFTKFDHILASTLIIHFFQPLNSSQNVGKGKIVVHIIQLTSFIRKYILTLYNVLPKV